MKQRPENTKIKLLHILYSGQGGLGTYFMNFVQSDERQLFEHHALFYGIEPLYEEYEEFCKKWGITYKYINKQTKFDFRSYLLVSEYTKSLCVAVVFLHTYSLTPFYFFIRKRAFKLIAFEHTSPKFKSAIEKVYSRINASFSDQTVSFFNSKKSIIKGQGEGKQWLIPKSVDLTVFSPLNTDIDHPVFTFGMVGRIIKGKRFDLLIHAVGLLNQSGFKVLLRIAGDGSDKEAMVRLVKEKGLEEHIYFCGLLKQTELANFYRGLSAYVHATEGETICYSIMEAQACGLPIIASNVEGVNDVIVHEEAGILFENNLESIQKALVAATQNKTLLKKLGIVSRSLAIRNSKLNRPAEDIYQLIINQ